MTVTEALKILNSYAGADTALPLFRLELACGFTPLHLQTFLAAHAQQRVSGARVEVSTGLFGDLAGTLESLRTSEDLQGVAVVLEWSDLDPRLGYRSLGGWKLEALEDIEKSVALSLARLRTACELTPQHIRMALSLPTLSLPPLFHTANSEASPVQLRMQAAVSGFGAAVSSLPNVRVANTQCLAKLSEPGSRLDLKSEIRNGFPFSLKHADAIARVLVDLVVPNPPKKALITDLDDTLWKGIAGEIGPANVAWDLAGNGQLHGLYQQLLSSLASAGVLIGVASKNEPGTVRQVFTRQDILLDEESIFPFEVHWNAKSGSVSSILGQWNIGAAAVVFVDDSPMELEEVRSAHPEIECLLFPKNDYEGTLQFLELLRDRFGRHESRQEDALRLKSLRQAAVWNDTVTTAPATMETLLAGADARLIFDFQTARQDGRVLELVNKTNQFNLNGARITEADWHRQLACPGSFVCSVSYQDKFGPLGKIAVVKGCHIDGVLNVDTWVMSCRAFSRRIEHRTIEVLFEHFHAREVSFRFLSTPKNGPVQSFLEALVGSPPKEDVRINQSMFKQQCPALYQQVEYTSA